jgi:phosphatidylserine decarboxylase
LNEIRIWNRQARREETEKVYGDKWVKWLYGTPTGQRLTDSLLTRPFISKAYGAFQSSALSRKKVRPFIQDFSIPMQEYENRDFSSFNEFFIRKFRPGAREFVATPSHLSAFAEARYLAWDKVRPDETFPVKGSLLTPALLLESDEFARGFDGGALMIARLCPVDYHRFHFPESGRVEKFYEVRGKLHSVNPVALQYRNEIFCTNERHVSILETENFGRIAYIEVGALCVGRIVQTHPMDRAFRRGDEKGYFLFGGSTVIILGEPGRWRPDQDLLERTAKKQECLVRLGEKIGQAG